MEFGIEKCAMLVMKSGKRHMTDGMELPNHDRIRTLEEKETYKYLGILEPDTIKQVQMKDTIRKEYLRRTIKRLEIKISSRNLIKGINTRAVPLVRYSGPFLKWTREDTVDPFIQRLEDYIEKHERGLITAIRNDTDNTIDERVITTRKQKWGGKQLYRPL